MKIGIVGIGKMGAAIATRLAGLGHEVIAWNRTAAKAQALAPSGVETAATPRELATQAEIIISILTDASALPLVLMAKLKPLSKLRSPGSVPPIT